MVRWWLLPILVSWIVPSLGAAQAVRVDVPDGCASVESFTARVLSLGASLEGARLSVAVSDSWSGLLHGSVVVERDGAVSVERVIEDEGCQDVVDALAISAALVLRSSPLPITDHGVPVEERSAITANPSSEGDAGNVVASGEDDDRTPDDPVAAPSGPLVWIGAGVRVGRGPTPGLALAPDLGLGVEVERFSLALHALYWPDAAFLSEAGTGVSMLAFATGVEVGGRIGDEFGLIPAAMVELGVGWDRSVGVAQASSATAFLCDVGAALTGYLAFGPVRLLLRADVLFAAAQPVVVLDDGSAAYEAPVVRGTGALGLAYVVP